MMLMARMFSPRWNAPGPDATVAAHDQVDGDAGLARLVEPAHDGRVLQRIHLGHDLAGRPLSFRLISFSINCKKRSRMLIGATNNLR